MTNPTHGQPHPYDSPYRQAPAPPGTGQAPPTHAGPPSPPPYLQHEPLTQQLQPVGPATSPYPFPSPHQGPGPRPPRRPRTLATIVAAVVGLVAVLGVGGFLWPAWFTGGTGPEQTAPQAAPPETVALQKYVDAVNSKDSSKLDQAVCRPSGPAAIKGKKMIDRGAQLALAGPPAPMPGMSAETIRAAELTYTAGGARHPIVAGLQRQPDGHWCALTIVDPTEPEPSEAPGEPA